MSKSQRGNSALKFCIEGLENRQLMAANVWKSGVSGNWSDASKWSLGHVPTKAEDVVINAAGNYTVTVGDGKTNVPAYANKLTVGGGTGTQTLNVTFGTLTTYGTTNVQTGDVLTLSGGNVYVYPTSGSATLNGTVNILGDTQKMYSDFNLGGVSYTGTGKINMNVTGGALYYVHGGLRGYGATLGSGINVTANTGNIYGKINNLGTITLNGKASDRVYLTSVTNKGTINNTTGGEAVFSYLDNQKTINLSGGKAKFSSDFKNSSVINAANVALDYNMNITSAGVGKVNRTNSPVTFTGNYNANGGAFTFDGVGKWFWKGGRLINGSYDPKASTALVLDGVIGTYGTTQNITITNDWAIAGGTYVNNYGKVTLSGANRKILLNGTATKVAGLYFYAGGLEGTGEVVFNSPNLQTTARNVISGNGVTIGKNILVHGNSGTLGGGLTNNGTISADKANEPFLINDIINNGTLMSAPGTMKVYKFKQSSTGTLAVGIGGTSVGSQVGQFTFADSSYASVLAGNAKAVLLNGYKPSVGSKFAMATFTKAPTGAFASTNLNAGNGIGFDLAASSTSLTLTTKLLPSIFANREISDLLA